MGIVTLSQATETQVAVPRSSLQVASLLQEAIRAVVERAVLAVRVVLAVWVAVATTLKGAIGTKGADLIWVERTVRAVGAGNLLAQAETILGRVARALSQSVSPTACVISMTRAQLPLLISARSSAWTPPALRNVKVPAKSFPSSPIAPG